MSESEKRDQPALEQAERVSEQFDLIEDQISDRGITWSQWVERQARLLQESGADSGASHAAVCGNELMDLIPEMREAEETGSGLLNAQLRIVEVIVKNSSDLRRFTS